MKESRMAGKGSSSASQKPSASSQNKSRSESSKNPPPDHKLSHSPSVPAAAAAPSPKLPPAPLPPSAASPLSFPDTMHPPAPTYGFHMLDRRTIVLADGSVRSYFALPPDFPVDDKFPPYGRPGIHGVEPGGGRGLGFDRNFPPPGQGRLSPDALIRDREREDHYGRGGPLLPDHSLKRKHAEEDEFARQRQRQQLLQYGNPNHSGFPGGDRPGGPRGWGAVEDGRGVDDLGLSKHSRGAAPFPPESDVAAGSVDAKHLDVDPVDLKKSFLNYVKSVNENGSQRKNYLENGKNGALRCLVCDRNSKDYTDVHGLVMHAYYAQSPRVEHLAFYKALCVLMGWNYMIAPDSSKEYQSLSEDEATTNREDLIMWPPTVIIHNTNTGKRKDGRMDGMGNREVDNILKDLGFGGGKSKSIYGKDGHTGMTVVKFANSQSGLEEAERLVQYLEKDDHGRKGWACIQDSLTGTDDENNPQLVKVNPKTGEKKRILYGYLGAASDLDKVDFDTKKRSLIKSKRELDVTW